MNALERRVRGELAEGRSNPAPITWQKSAEGIVAGGNEPQRRRTHPGEGPNGIPGDYLGK